MTRKLLIGLMVIIAVLSLSTVVFAGGQSETAEEAAEDAMTLKIAAPPGLTHLNPQNSTTRYVFQATQYVYESLFRLEDGKLTEWLVTDYDLSDDGTVYTWYLEEDVVFHDGSEFNADVVKWNLDRKLDNKMPMHDFVAPYLDKIEIVDDYTLKIHLTQPVHDLHNILASQMWAMYPVSFEDKSEEWMNSNMVGTGPFVQTDYKQGEYLHFERFGDYWQPELVYWDKIEYQIVPDHSTRASLLEAGRVDVGKDIAIPDIARMKDGVPGIKVEGFTDARQFFVALNAFRKGFDEPKVKRALNHAIDRQAILDSVYYGIGGSIPKAPWAPLSCPGVEPVGEYTYDLDLAGRLLDEAGWRLGSDGVREKNGEKLAYEYWYVDRVEDRAVAEIIQRMLKDVGADINISSVDPATWREQVTVEPEYSKYDMLFLSAGAYSGSVEWYMRTFYHTDSWAPRYFNRAYYSNDRVDALIEEGFDAPKPEERYSKFTEALKIAYQDPPAIILWDSMYWNAMREDITGVEFDPIIGISPTMFSREK